MCEEIRSKNLCKWGVFYFHANIRVVCVCVCVCVCVYVCLCGVCVCVCVCTSMSVCVWVTGSVGKSSPVEDRLCSALLLLVDGLCYNVPSQSPVARRYFALGSPSSRSHELACQGTFLSRCSFHRYRIESCAVTRKQEIRPCRNIFPGYWPFGVFRLGFASCYPTRGG